MPKNYINKENLSISEDLYKFINEEAIPGTEISKERFWKGLSKITHELNPKNKELLRIRKKLQIEIDKWHLENYDKEFNLNEYKSFLKKIGYLKEEGPDFKIKTKNIDNEISNIAGPQLVVPIMNARYALNAANARWMSLYDSLYGTDVISSEESITERYDPERGLQVIKYTKKFLDENFKLKNASWDKVSQITIDNHMLKIKTNKGNTEIEDVEKYIGYRLKENKVSAIILKNNNLHIEIIINPGAFSAKGDPAGISDIIVESAISTICDHEDSVAAVDSEDKIIGYRNWLGLMKKDLVAEFEKDGKKLIRKLNPNRSFISKKGKRENLHGRALLLNRNVGHLMTNSAVLLQDGSEIPEGILDAFVTSLCAVHDINNKNNSRMSSIYIVKPKQHGPEETAFTNLLFTKVEEVLGLEKFTIKCGIMDEERRTTINLKECIRTLENRVFFINTGFLDRTGDEMHTSMEAGPMMKKGEMKTSVWINAYENNNVDIGLKCGFSGVAQIGKGMWAMPDKMADMLKQKISHLEAGANCAWVPSPTAAALHSLHYHQINIFDKHKKLKNRQNSNIDDLLNIPVVKKPNWSIEEINQELSNSAQTILGYVVRWIDQGVGCSKVPDINNVGLMEDRATLRISSQQITNWLYHGICSRKQVLETMKKMAKIVDKQNINDKFYQKMSPYYDRSIAFKTACELVFQGKDQPSGYTEPLLHLNRLIKKN
ncbi:malate synthase G [Candidatus Pelagibacter sp.]|nr:malate synthase G [Candidatus Pelagibacter sp.]